MIKKIITSILLATFIICSVIFGAVVAMAEEGGVEPLSSATEEKIAVGDLSGVYVANTPVELKNGEEVIGTLKISKDSSGPAFQAGSIFSFVPNEKYTVKKVIYLANYVTANFTIGSGCSSVSGLTDEEMAMLTQAGITANQDTSCVVLLNPEHTATEADPYQFTLNAEVDRGSICIIYEKKTYKETIVTNKNNYSNIIVGESYGQNAATIKFTGTGQTTASSITLTDNSKCYITPSPGYVIESVTFTNSATYNWALRQEGGVEMDLTFEGSHPTYTLTGFKVGQSYDLYSRTNNYASITSITVTYTEHEHDFENFTPNHDEDNHWEECICKARINETAHNWEFQNETQPSAGLAGERKFECSDCHAEKTEIIPCEITDENITVSLANQLRYTSASLTQKVVIKVGDTVLQEYVDYTLSGNSGRDPGNYTLTITGKGKYSGTRELDFSILKGQVAIPAADTTAFYYTGANQTYYLPTSIRYDIVGSTTKSTAGRTDIVLSLKDTSKYEWADGTTDNITYVFEIAKATYDMSGVVFEDNTVTYNGSEFSLEATNLPTGVTVTYENNGKTAAGEYIVVAKFTGSENYNDIPDQTAVLTIEKATYNMSGVVFNGLTVTYDGNTYSLEATNLPAGVTVTYENNDKTNAGTYTVVAKFTGDANYNAISDMEATLIINKATYDMSGIKYDDVTVTYNGSEHTVVITGTLPNGVTVSYTTNKGTNAGTYNAVASFTGDANYNDIPDMEATLTINKATCDMSGVVFGDTTVIYNGTAQSVLATNLPTGVTVTYENNGKTNVGTYTVVAKFTGSENYNDIPDQTAKLIINKATYDMSGVVFGDTAVTYNGTAQSILATNLPTGVTVTYENNGKTNAGVYTVVAKFTGDATNYNAIPNKEATLTIKNASLSFNSTTDDKVTDDIFVSSEDGIDPNKELFVEVIPVEKTTDDFVEFLDKNHKVAVAYDIKLLMDGVSVQPDGTLKFKVLIPEDLRETEFGIMHIHNGTEKAMLEYEIEGDYVIFESDKLSEFVFVYEVHSLLWVVLVLTAIVIAEAAVLIFLMNKKKQLGSRKLAATYPPFVFGMFLPEWNIAMIAILGVAVIALAAIDIVYALKLIKAKSLAYEGVYAEVPVVEESVTEKSTVKNTVAEASIVDNAIANEVAIEETVVEETIDYTKCIVGIVWAEKTKSNRVYRYNVGNEKIKVGDIVVAPTFDSHSQKEVAREARVVSIEYYNDGDNIVLPRKSIISVEKKSSKNYKPKF